jgi:hypothetical protein
MPAMPPITVPIPTELTVTALKCCPCLDEAISSRAARGPIDLSKVPDAITMAPSMQVFSGGGQSIAAPVVLPVCLACRINQTGMMSKAGLTIA